MAQNKGTLIGDTIRTIDDTDTFPVVESNSIQGGIHLVNSVSELTTNFINKNFRQFGMLAFVKDIQKYYALLPKGPVPDPLVERDSNWTLLNFGESGGLEWIDSVIAVYNSGPAGINGQGLLKTGNRFLVSNSPGGSFGSNANKIAIYDETADGNNGAYSFIEPTNGYTVRVDTEPNVIYTFVGTSSVTGNWYQERQNTVRYINPTSADGLTFSFTTSDGAKPLLSYTYGVYMASFGTANAGACSLSIDGNFFAPIKKASSNVLTDLDASDFDINIEYLLSFSEGVFQIFLPSGGGGGTIGPPEDDTYDDGLYTDFDPSTPIGIPIDRFNQILKSLVPPQAPNLSSWSVTNTSQFVGGKISYTSVQAAGFAQPYTVVSAPPAIADIGKGGLYSVTGYRLGVTNKITTPTITGILNSEVNIHPSQPIPAYAQYAIGNGITGSVVLYINSKTASTANLGSSLNQITDNNVDATLVLSSATSSKFSNGTPFEAFYWRTGEWTVKKSSSFINNGFNQIQVKHILPSTTYTLTSYEFLIDAETTATIYTSPGISNFSLKTTKYLSGIEFLTNIKFTYQVTVDNAYRNTYSPDSNAISFADTSLVENTTVANGASYVTITSDVKPFLPETPNKSLDEPSDVSQQITPDTVYALQSNRRKLGGSVKLTTTVKRTVQSTLSNDLTLAGWFIDTYSPSSTSTKEEFEDERYRLAVAVWDSTAGISTGTWPSNSTLSNTNGLQVIGGRLVYPFFNFPSVGDSDRNPNVGQSTRDYTNCRTNVNSPVHGGNTRTYIRYFDFGTKVANSFTMTVKASSNTNFVTVGSNLSSSINNCYIEFKLPYKGSGTPNGGLVGNSVTGWLDGCLGYTDILPPTDRQGCLEGNVPPPTAGTEYEGWRINFGKKSTLFSDGKVLMRLTVGPNFNGFIDSIEITNF